MAAYEYIALDAGGRQKKGVIEADSSRQIRQMLRDQGLVPLSVDTASERSERAGAPSGRRWRWRRGISALDLALFTRQMSTLLAASLPIEEALRAVAQQTEKAHVSTMVMGIRSRVLEGHSLASSLAEFPSAFSHLYRSTVMAGEQSGHLDSVLENLASYTERRYDSSRNVEMAMFYPAILFLLAIGIVGALLVYVVPDIVHVFENTGQKLPWLTSALIGLSEFVRGYGWLLAIVAVGCVFSRALALATTRLPAGVGSAEVRSAARPAYHAGEQFESICEYAEHSDAIGRAASGGDDDRGRGGRQYVAEEAPDGSNEARQRRIEPSRRARSRR